LEKDLFGDRSDEEENNDPMDTTKEAALALVQSQDFFGDDSSCDEELVPLRRMEVVKLIIRVMMQKQNQNMEELKRNKKS